MLYTIRSEKVRIRATLPPSTVVRQSLDAPTVIVAARIHADDPRSYLAWVAHRVATIERTLRANMGRW